MVILKILTTITTSYNTNPAKLEKNLNEKIIYAKNAKSPTLLDSTFP